MAPSFTFNVNPQWLYRSDRRPLTIYNKEENMKLSSVLFQLFLCLFLFSCGGGGSGPSGNNGTDNSSGRYSIDLDANELQLLISPYGDSITSQEVKASFTGDGVLVGYPPGEQEPSWLIVDTKSMNSQEATFELKISPHSILDPGLHFVMLRFTSGKADGSEVVYEDLRIFVTVDEEFRVSTPSKGLEWWSYDTGYQDLEFWAVGNSPENVMPYAPPEFNIHGERTQWTLSSSENWLTTSEQTGTGRSTIELGVNLDGLDYGLHQAELSVNDAYSGNSEVLSVSFDYKPKNTGVVVTDSQPWQFDFNSQLDTRKTSFIVDEAKQKIYATDPVQKRLYIVNSVTGLTEKYFDFKKIPWNMDLSSDGLLYIALLEQMHSPYSSEKDQRGTIALFDTNSETVINEFRMYMAPGDLVVTDSNQLIIGVASGQHVPIVSFNATTGEREGPVVTSTSPIQKIELLPDQRSIIYRSNWQSPPPVYKAGIENTSGGGYTEFEDDHGDWQSHIDFWLSADGSRLLTSYGDVYNTEDVSHITRITEPYVYIDAAVLDEENDRMIVLDTENRLIEYNSSTFEEVSVLAEEIEQTHLILHLNGEFRALRSTEVGTELELLNW